MKTLIALSVLFSVLAKSAGATDPVQDYLVRFSPLRGDKTIYSSDTLLRLDIDLNNDGRNEVLLSMARDRNGKQGNVWSVYTQNGGEYFEVARPTFSSSGFYLGPIEELHQYGLVTFWPGGGGEGLLSAYLFDGSAIREVQVASVVRDPTTGDLQGQQIVDKYMKKALVGDTVITSIGADTLAQKYGTKIDPKNYREFVEELYQSQQVEAKETAVAKSSVTPVTSVAHATEIPSPSPPAVRSKMDASNATTFSHVWFVVTVLMLGLGAALAMLYLKRRS